MRGEDSDALEDPKRPAHQPVLVLSSGKEELEASCALNSSTAMCEVYLFCQLCSAARDHVYGIDSVRILTVAMALLGMRPS